MLPIRDNERICPMCGRLAFNGVTHRFCKTKYGIDGLTSFFHYSGPVRSAIKQIKYRGVSDLAKEFMSLTRMPDRACLPARQVGHNMFVVPIPLHPKKYRERGFNQTEVLARYIPLPMRTDVLCRIRATPPQAEIKTKKERLENMKHSFVSSSITGNVLLFDDVTTTGATLREAAAALKRAGANHVWAMTIAR